MDIWDHLFRFVSEHGKVLKFNNEKLYDWVSKSFFNYTVYQMTPWFVVKLRNSYSLMGESACTLRYMYTIPWIHFKQLLASPNTLMSHNGVLCW